VDRLSEQPVPAEEEVLAIGRVHWAGLLQERQRHLRRILDAAREVVTRAGPWWSRLLTAGIQLLRRQEHRFITEFVGDVIGYRQAEVQAGIYAAITEALDALADAIGPGPGKAPLTIIAHSLGTVIGSDYVWDMTQARAAGQEPGFHAQLTLENLFTVGSPLALFSLRYGQPAVFSQPVTVESPRGRWVNIYDKDDPVGMPLKPLNAAYDRAVFADARVDAGRYLFAHGGYFSRSAALALITRKLAADWLARNRIVGEERLQALDAAYDRALSAGS
jgi:hypothetical protein